MGDGGGFLGLFLPGLLDPFGQPRQHRPRDPHEHLLLHLELAHQVLVCLLVPGVAGGLHLVLGAGDGEGQQRTGQQESGVLVLVAVARDGLEEDPVREGPSHRPVEDQAGGGGLVLEHAAGGEVRGVLQASAPEGPDVGDVRIERHPFSAQLRGLLRGTLARNRGTMLATSTPAPARSEAVHELRLLRRRFLDARRGLR